MLLFNALQQLAAQPGYFARRPAGVVLQITDRMKLVTFRTGREYRWTPKYRDLVADDWEVISMDRFVEEIRLMQQQAELAQAEQSATDTEANNVVPIR